MTLNINREWASIGVIKFQGTKINRYLLENENWNVESWWKYFYERDKCILATSTENMNKEPLISKFRVPKNLFRSSGFSFKVKEAESNFLENAYNKLNQK